MGKKRFSLNNSLLYTTISLIIKQYGAEKRKEVENLNKKLEEKSDHEVVVFCRTFFDVEITDNNTKQPT